MTHRLFSLISMLAMVTAPAVVRAADIWTEDFTGQEGKGMYGDSTIGIVTNLDDITEWTVYGASGLNSDAGPNFWMVTNGAFQGQDVGTAIGYWNSRSIDVTGNSSVNVQMYFAKVGNGCDAGVDSFKVGYRLDGGSFADLLVINTNNQDSLDASNWTSTDIDVAAATGLVIEARIAINGAGDGWAFDNVTLQTGGTGPSQPASVWINELHYDSAGTDTNDGFEIAGQAGTDLADYRVYAYNGADSNVYATFTLGGLIDNEKQNHGAVWFDQGSRIQNGSPDALALVYVGGGQSTLMQFISYEGTLIGSGGAADGVQSDDIGVSEDGSPDDESLQLIGSGQAYTDFTWVGPTNHSRGFLNSGQDIRFPSTVLIIH